MRAFVTLIKNMLVDLGIIEAATTVLAQSRRVRYLVRQA
jgi:hypothetical protein